MSGAERSYRIALLAFPKAYRRERGEEIVATILEGGDGSRPRLREFFGLFFAGIGQRGLGAGGERAAGSVRAGLRLGAYLLLCVPVVFAVEAALVPRANPGYLVRYELSTTGSAAIGVIVLLALSRGWWMAPLGFVVAWSIADHLFLNSIAPLPWHWMLLSVALGFLPALLCVLARPRGHEPRDLRSPLWAIAAPALGALMAWHATSWLEWLLVVLLATWLVLGWRDLRLAIAAATITAFVGLSIALLAYSDSWIAPHHLVAYAFLLGAAVTAGVGFGGRRVNA
jgi:hypothetical protein